MYVNEKQYLLKLFQKSGDGQIKESSGEGELEYDIFNTL
jgi:hypothetical protein